MKSNMPKTKELHLCFSSQTATHDPIDIDGEAVVTDDHAVDGCNSRGGGALPYIVYTYMGMCRWKGYGFQAI